MSWVLFALLSAAMLAGINILDKKLTLRHHMPDIRAFYFLVGITVLGTGLLTFLVKPMERGIPAHVIWVMVGSGVLWVVGFVPVWIAMRLGEEVSRITPLQNTTPIWVAFIAMPFLGERLEVLQWVGVLLTVAGAVLVSYRQLPSGRRAVLGKGFVLVLLGALLVAGGQVTTKYGLNYLNLWNAYGIRNIGGALPLLLMGSPRVLRNAIQSVRRPRTLGLFVASKGVLHPVSMFLLLWATQLGPVSLVSALTLTRPLFVLAYSTILSTSLFHVMDEPLRREVVGLKLASTLMVVMGASAIVLL